MMIVPSERHLPVVSIIIPVFNDPEALARCLSGIRALNWPANMLEVIVIDNASCPPVSTLQPEQFTTRLIHCARPGSYAARNAGAREAHGDVLAFIDADCIPDQSWLTHSMASLQSLGDKAIIGGNVIFIFPENPSLVAKYQLAIGFQQHENITEKHFSATANLLCTKAAFDNVGEFDERLLSGGDREWCWRAIGHGYQLHYCQDSIVRTLPRQSFGSAIRQTRRVAAGRKHLRELGLDHASTANLAPSRSIWQSMLWISRLSQYSIIERAGIFTLATLLKCVSILESARVMLGGEAERR